MPCDVKRVIEVAQSQINYLEKETWDQLDDFTANAGDENYVKYSRDLAKYSYFNSSKKGVAWCSIFVAWDFVEAFGVNAARALLCQPVKDNCGAGCTSAMNYFKNKKRVVYSDPQPGDVIFFYSADKKEQSHTGLVYKVDSSYVYTIEGNTSSASGVVANGGAVASKKYKLNYDRIAGYGRPDYANIDPDEGYEETPVIQENEQPKEEKDVYIGTAIVTPKTGKTVNFRKTPSKTAGRVDGCVTITGGEQVNVKSTDGTWAAIEYNGYKGYMMAEFLVMNTAEATGKTTDEIVAEITKLLSELAARAK